MVETLRSFPVANLVQGVSQQAEPNRRETQCDAQFDCWNDPTLGVVSRLGSEFSAWKNGKDYTNAFFYEIRRGTNEQYLVVITSGLVEVYDVTTGNLATVTLGSGATTYFTCSGLPKDVFVATTIEDFTFIANKEKVPAFSGDASPAGVNQAIVYWKAGAYSITYQLSVTYSGAVYTFKYVAPDNSAAANAELITSNAVAATFYRAITGSVAVPTPTATPATAFNQNVGAANAGQTTGMTGGTTLASLGFNVRLSGNVLLIGRGDANAFSVDTSDGVGDTFMKAVKDNVQSFSDLPRNCFQGFTTKVRGTNRETADDYYVQYQAGDGSQGYWQETLAPGTPTTLNTSRLPFTLVNTGVNTFDLKAGAWGARVAGDGINSSVDPSFVGKPIQDIFFDSTRLAILTEGACAWSKPRNPFVFFPASAQTVLDTDPVDVKIAGGKRIALLRKGVLAAEATFLWAQAQQFRISSGTETFKQTSVESKPSTAFEFSEKVLPLTIADSLYFVTETNLASSLRDLTVIDGRPRGVADVTAHVPEYLPQGLSGATASDIHNFVALWGTINPSNVYFYNFLLGASQTGVQTRLQSAWNTWRLPALSKVLWLSMKEPEIKALIQRPSGVAFVRIWGMPKRYDGNNPANRYHTRLDFRLDETQVAKSYDAITKRTTLTLPFPYTEAETDLTQIIVAQRTTNGDTNVRGKLWPIVSLSGTALVVDGDVSAQQFYIGFRIVSERTESRFFIRTPQGVRQADRLQVGNYVVTHSDTGYYRAEVTYVTGNAPVKAVEFTARVLGDPLNVLGSYPLGDGSLRVPVNSESYGYSLKLVNDSILPSYWVTAEYHYSATFTAPQTSSARGGGV